MRSSWVIGQVRMKLLHNVSETAFASIIGNDITSNLLKKIIVANVAYFSKTCYRTMFQHDILNCASSTPTVISCHVITDHKKLKSTMMG
jgi:hypothetical protein